MTEAAMTINGRPLTVGQSMTIRVALESLAIDLAVIVDGNLADDEIGKTLAVSYLDNIRSLRALIA